MKHVKYSMQSSTMWFSRLDAHCPQAAVLNNHIHRHITNIPIIIARPGPAVVSPARYEY